jgi:hypothetical protein
VSSLLEEYGFVDGAHPDSAGGPQAPGAEGALPCQESGKSDKASSDKASKLTASQKGVAYALKENCRLMIEKYGADRIGFLTLTFADLVKDTKEAQRRFSSLSRGVLKRYEEWIAVIERTKKGRIHFHLLVVCVQDIRRGIDFSRIKAKEYSTANAALRAEWLFWRKVAPKYRFGRTELLPVKSAGGVGTYISKYISKHIGQRREEDKGAHLVRYSIGAGRVCSKFSFASVGCALWRGKLKLLAEAFGLPNGVAYEIAGRGPRGGLKLRNVGDLTKAFGGKWAYKLQAVVRSLKLPFYRTGRMYNADNKDSLPEPNGVEWLRDHSLPVWELLETAVRVVLNEGGRLWENGALWCQAAFRFGWLQSQ